MSVRRVVAALLAMMVGAAGVDAMLGVPPASAADSSSTDSATTLSGNGDFATLKVTVSQTKNLINQVVTISWQGGSPTTPGGGQFGTNYLQIMQCWGDDPGPDRTQCQFGASGSTAGGTFASSRQITSGSFVDPKEKLTLPADQKGTASVPFWPVGSDKPANAVVDVGHDFFDALSTNEIPYAQTNADGTGLQFFEVQTTHQAAGLGCGDPITNGGVIAGRKCWLVIVPRGTKEVDGTAGHGSSVKPLESSPLSQSNWDNRIVFPLEFQPVGQSCPLGSAERRMVGHELALEAVSRWQPALCAGGGALFSYSEVPDDIARNLVEGGQSPGLALMTNPVPAAQAPPGGTLVYAPVALSGLVIAFDIEHHTDSSSPPDAQKLNGQRFNSMKLTPRLVAKLVTQSYRRATAGFDYNQVPDYLKNNPDGLTSDPEFLELNPEYQGANLGIQPPDALVQLSGADVISLLWSWIKADPDASAFLAGSPDPHGMVVNPNNKGLTLPISNFPRNDQSCVDVPTVGRSCTLDKHPYFNDMHEVALNASRGDEGGRSPQVGSPGDLTPPLAKDPRQPPGGRALVAVTEAATAVRYDLPTASLQTAAHTFVAPTTASLQAGAAAMKPSEVAGVLAADPATPDPAAYPLTALSYAVASPSSLDAAAGKDYAAFVRYAVGLGQQLGADPGQLPFGMAPLPDPLRAQATVAAATIEAQAGKNPTPTSPGQVPGGPSATVGDHATGVTPGTGTAAPSGTGDETNGGSGAPAAPAGVPNPSSTVAQSPGAVPKPVGARSTPAVPAPVWVGAVLLVTLICGALAATSSPILQSPLPQRLIAALRRRLRRGVMPTER